MWSSSKQLKPDEDDSDVEADEAEYQRTAQEIAEKVRRQQMGEESNMLTEEHRDDEYQLTVDQVQELLQSQISSMSKRIFQRSMNTGSDGVDSDTLSKWFLERARFVPMRLTLPERKTLRLVDAFLRGSTYVDRVDDVYSKKFTESGANTNKVKMLRVREKLRCISTTFIGFIAALDHRAGKELANAKSPDFAKYQDTFRTAFEIVRRYKIMNPDRLRDTYGKLIMMLQDACSPEAREMLGFEVVAPIKTVYSRLEEADRLDLMKSEWTSTATMEVVHEPSRSREEIRQQVKVKENALTVLASKFTNGAYLSKDDVKQCLYSMGDNSSYLNSNCKPIDEMIEYLKKYFDPDVVGEDPPENRSLAIYGGTDGARLTHSHKRQYHYVLQTMSLWREILHEIFRLWTLAETDLLDTASPYKWRDTGQGFHRLQDSPRISKAMHGILYRVQQNLGSIQGWVGSSVIHINDANVPNALVFIDKWNQVPRILNPIVQTLRHIDSFVAPNQALLSLVTNAFGGVDGAKMRILHSFFRQGFDGSGGDDWFSAGSCVDARLTSSWNWCQDLPQRDYFFLFRLAGFLGFDGEF